MPGMTEESFRSGFLSFVGRPNTGKSTLTNALVGEKIAITADQPETTRHPIRGIVNRPDSQVILVDTPGLHRPRTLLGERLNDMVREAYADVDVIALTVPADQKIGPGDRWILRAVREAVPRTPVVGVVTKLDAASKDAVGAQLLALRDLLEESGLDNPEVVPVSAAEGVQLDVLLDVVVSMLPEGPQLYPEGHITDDDVETRIAELVREAALMGGLRDELPHSVAVQVDEILPDATREGVTDVHAVIFVERPSQKKILMGKDNRRMGSIIHRSRLAVGELLGTRVYMDLRIKVLPGWQSDPKALGRLGF